MSIPALKAKVRTLAQELASRGFEYGGPYLTKRQRRKLVQFIELQPGQGHLAGRYTSNIAWRFEFEGIGETGFHHSIRLGRLLGASDAWFPHEPAQALEESYERVRRALEVYAVPF